MGTKMNLIFYCFLAVVSSRTLETAGNGDLESKLNQYQAITGIDDDKRNEIWNTTMKNLLRTDSRNSNEKVMARYGISGELSGTVSPVNLDIEYFNLGMMYQSGIFIIVDPGYYRMNVQCYHNQNGADFSKYAALEVHINNRAEMRTYCMYANNGSVNGIFYLEAFDTVFMRKFGEKLQNNGLIDNNFMIEKI